MGSYISRRMTEENQRNRSDSESDSDSVQSLQDFHHNYNHIIQSLINGIMVDSGQVQIRPSVYVASYCGSKLPQVEKPITTNLNVSEFLLITKQASGMLGCKRRKVANDHNVANIIINRESGLYLNNNFSNGTKCRITNKYLPNDITVLDSFAGKVFCGLFSKDGNRFITASQDRSIRLYDSSTSKYKFLHSIQARDVGWSIIDVAFSSKGEHFVYSTWSSALHLCSAVENTDHQEPLSLLRSGRRFCIFSVVFSADGRELLGGANDGCLYLYDLETKTSTLNIPAHEYDVNSVCFADDSSHIIYSGGDDGIVKVWDRRTLNENLPTPVGILAGHMDGITFVESKGDGRHLISNSKDQSIKLWDVRRFSNEETAEKSLKAVSEQTWDYRWQEVPKKLLTSQSRIGGDTSIMTYRGHVVTKTLIRCRFSPRETTGQRYIYTGCGAGRVVIYDSLTGEIVQSINGHGACVRDVDWHPVRNEILSSSWDSTVGRWSYLAKEAVDESEEFDVEFYTNHSPRTTRRSLRLALKRRRQ